MILNGKVVSILKELDITKEQRSALLACLFCISNGYTVKWVSKDILTLLTKSGLVYKGPNSKATCTYVLYIDPNTIVVKHKRRTLGDKTLLPFMEKWLALFPTRMITGLSYDVSGNTTACITRMKRFVQDFNKVFVSCVGYSNQEVFELIYQATKVYLEFQKNRNWERTKKNSKFISDMNGSVLENYVQIVLQGTNNISSLDGKQA